MMMRRRESLVAMVLAGPSWPLAASARQPGLQTLNVPEPIAQVAAGGPSGILAVSRQGALFALGTDGGPTKALAEGIDPHTPLAADHGRIAARQQDGALWVQPAEGGAGRSQAGTLAPAAGLLLLPLAIIGVAAAPAATGHRLLRLEPSGPTTWAPVARSSVDVLPDARPLQADLAGSGDGGQVVVLAGPDSERYRHGVLGDAIEATRLCLLERHSLQLQRELLLPAPLVLEDIAPRRVQLAGRDGLLTVQSGPQGAQLLLVDADPSSPRSLRINASGPALGTANRWLSPSTDGQRWLAVHTPHIGGVLHEYRMDAQTLKPTRVRDGVSNHSIGSRRLDLAAWQGPWLLMPDQQRQQLLLLDGRAGWRQVQAWSLPARLTATASLGATRCVVLLLEDGSVAIAQLPA